MPTSVNQCDARRPWDGGEIPRKRGSSSSVHFLRARNCAFTCSFRSAPGAARRRGMRRRQQLTQPLSKRSDWVIQQGSRSHEVEIADEAGRQLPIILFNVAQPPTRAVVPDANGFREVAVALPAPDTVRRHAVALRDLSHGKEEGRGSVRKFHLNGPSKMRLHLVTIHPGRSLRLGIFTNGKILEPRRDRGEAKHYQVDNVAQM